MSRTEQIKIRRERRIRRIRKRVSGTAERPRLRVTRTLKHIYAQIIDDERGVTLAAVSSVSLKIPGGNIEAARQVGRALGETAVGRDIRKVCFDRGGRKYHGRVKALADAAREAGLEF
ncbi:MAG TPA: 50S ribosomal protein L18 [Candidatus Hydrogenedentes bacterium]|nr:50S ribosomal protein L18 [Candidatus Hydrogenedentota bacterium]HOJ67831.1 50S ribosomal protein L18 [Candidatus Hydrogenedentota bacterium]HOK88818.1 50S ribosomal protein L18 [Candidatus Hydrogenedentota bacterium]HOV60664.1 50S ribosomal protein L18 [Candidatus Hydrogenedentota bacterium]